MTGPVGKLFGNLESYPVHNQIHGLVPIELYALVSIIFSIVGNCFSSSTIFIKIFVSKKEGGYGATPALRRSDQGRCHHNSRQLGKLGSPCTRWDTWIIRWRIEDLSITLFCVCRPRVQTYQYQDVPGVKRLIGGKTSPIARDNDETNVNKDAEWFVWSLIFV